LLGAQHRLIVRASNEAPLASIRPRDLEQVLMHLVVHARDSTKSHGPVVIESAGRRKGGWALDLRSNDYVAIIVSNTLDGASERAKPYVYEPFSGVTTSGTGWGICLAYSLLRNQGGELLVESRTGNTTAFTICLPCPVDGNLTIQRTSSDTKEYHPESETILLVDDDVGIGALVATALRSRGFNVLRASSAREAKSLFKLDPVSVEVLVTDVLMLGGAGIQLSQELTALKPNLRTIFFSGYPVGTFRDYGLKDTALYIQKPFTPEAIGRLVLQALDRNGR